MAAISETRPNGQHQRTPAGTGPALAVAGCLLVAGAVLLVAKQAAPDDRAIVLTADVLGIALPIGLGLFQLSRRPGDRFALLLVGAGLLWSLTALAQSGHSTVYSAGRVAVWIVEAALVYVVLAFPSGRLTAPAERLLAGMAFAIAGILFLPTALVAQAYPAPTPFASCGSDCPANAFAPGDTTPAFVTDFVRPLRETLVVLVWIGVAFVLTRRARGPSAMTRGAVVPVAAVAVLHSASICGYFALRAADTAAGARDVLGWIYVFSLAAVTLCFAAGLLRERLFVANALEKLTLDLTPHADAGELRTRMADALEDPPLRILYWVNGEHGRWVDETGWPVSPPGEAPGRAVTEIQADDRRIAAIVHDAALSQDPELVQAASSYALTALENDRLVGRLRSSLLELSESRARIASVADRERQRIERDLHDGAQQRLVALQIKLELLADRLQEDSPETAGAIRRLEDDVDATIDEVRSFSRGVYPSLLAEQGLSEALRAAGRGAPLPTMVDAAGVGRYSPEVEAAVYFSCVEALQNAGKHAGGATGVRISVSENERLRFEVRDDGAGFDSRRAVDGAGLTHLRDRLAAVGGKLDVESAPGRGTRISGVIPAERQP